MSCLLIVDEFSSLADSAEMAARVEKARSFGTSLILAPQVVDGMGGPVETARILGSVDTVIAHRVNTPEDIIGLAGTRQVPKLTTRLANDGIRRDRSIRMEHQLTIDPNRVQALPPGVVYVISRGKAAKAQILRAPEISAVLPAGSSFVSSQSSNGWVDPAPITEERTDRPAVKARRDKLPF
jgi:hypothetical protein